MFILYLLLAWSSIASAWQRQEIDHLAVVKDPVVDLCIHLPVQKPIPCSPQGSPTDGTCRRSHQLLKNEVVRCIRKSGDCVEVVCPHIMYGYDEKTQEPLRTFWMYNHHLMPLRSIHKDHLDLIPAAYNHQEDSGALVLTLPWNGYSVATRFMRDAQQDTETMVGVRFLGDDGKTVYKGQVPRICCHIEMPLNHPNQARKLFVALVNHLLDYSTQHDGVIPYVWGGSSCIHHYSDKFYAESGGWKRYVQQDPVTGYDCSELVLRMAQMAGISYPYKTTSMLAQFGRALQADETIEPGDLIWIQGHVMIVSNIEKHEFIEARGYDSGYGKVQRLKLSERFSGIITYDDLMRAYKEQKPLVSLNKYGTVQTVSPVWKIFKLC